jgi:hypothetical protein
MMSDWNYKIRLQMKDRTFWYRNPVVFVVLIPPCEGAPIFWFDVCCPVAPCELTWFTMTDGWVVTPMFCVEVGWPNNIQLDCCDVPDGLRRPPKILLVCCNLTHPSGFLF